MMYETSLPGNDLKNPITVDSLDQCLQLCQAEANCQFWTFRTEDFKCWLKAANGGKDTLSGHISGTRDCELSQRSYCKHCQNIG